MQKLSLFALMGLLLPFLPLANAEEPPTTMVVKPLCRVNLPPYCDKEFSNYFERELFEASFAWCRKQIETSRLALIRAKRPVLSPYFPVAQESLIIAPTICGPFAFSVEINKGMEIAKAGELLWIADIDFGMVNLSKTKVLQRWFDDEFGKDSLERAEQIFNHNLNGTITVSRDRCYFVDDRALYFNRAPNSREQIVLTRFVPLPTSLQRNSLRAVALDSGKLKWKIHGEISDLDGHQRPDSFEYSLFLSPPLVTPSDLISIVEKNKEMILLSLDPNHRFSRREDPGKAILWQTQLLAVGKGANEDFGRRIHTLTVVAADKLLICPTNLGALVAVDPTNHEVAWTARYAKAEAKRFENYSSTWRVTPPFVAGELVLYAPPDADALFAFKLADGKEAWKLERCNGDYLAGLHDGNAIIVESDAVRAVNVADGKEVWKIPFTGMLTGMGAIDGDLFYLPIGLGEEGQDGRIDLIDLKLGKLTSVWKPADKQSIGNLVIHKGKLISQSFEALTVFDLK